MNSLKKEKKVIEILKSCNSAIVAFSGGVDSSYLAFLAMREIAGRVVLVTGMSPSTSALQKKLVQEFLSSPGGEHIFLETREMEDERYRQNPQERCYYCKSEILGRIREQREESGAEVLLDGSNADDRHDFRPGTKAVREHGVISPLAEAGMTKQDIRERSRALGLKTWDQPSMPCLASRIPYGIEITEDAFRKIDEAEDFIRSLGISTFRVRHHDDLARIEVSSEEFASFLSVEFMEAVHHRLREIGYQYVTLNLLPFKSGSLNEGIVGLTIDDFGEGHNTGDRNRSGHR
ncbi:MAG: ATP-dependent sacrificial sulfur transferase LarE [Acidobacteriota bacterium]